MRTNLKADVGIIMNTMYVYTVKYGENLSDIAAKLLGINKKDKWVDLLMINPQIQVTYTRGNNIPVAHMFVGQRINIPSNWIIRNKRLGIGDDTATNYGQDPFIGTFELGKAPWDYFGGSAINWINHISKTSNNEDGIKTSLNYITSYFCDPSNKNDLCINEANSYLDKKFDALAKAKQWISVIISPDQSADTINWAIDNHPDWLNLNAIFPSNYTDFDDQILKLRLNSLKSDFINQLPTLVQFNWKRFINDNLSENQRRVALRNIILDNRSSSMLVDESNIIMDISNADSFIEKNWPISNNYIKNSVINEAYKWGNFTLPVDQYSAIQFNKAYEPIITQYVKYKFDKYLKGEDTQIIGSQFIIPIIPIQHFCPTGQIWDDVSRSCVEQRDCDIDGSECVKYGEDFDANLCKCVPRQELTCDRDPNECANYGMDFDINQCKCVPKKVCTKTATDCKDTEEFLESDCICVPKHSAICGMSIKDCTKDQVFDPKICKCIDMAKAGAGEGCKGVIADCGEGKFWDEKQCKCVVEQSATSNTLWYILGGLVILGGAGAGYYYYSKNKKQKSVGSGELTVGEPARAKQKTKVEYVLKLEYDGEYFSSSFDNQLYSTVGKYSDGSGMGFGTRDHEWYFSDRLDAESAKSRLDDKFGKKVSTWIRIVPVEN